MKTLAVDENNDLYLDINGNIAFAYDLEAIVQTCTRAVKVQLGELVYNTDIGIPNFQVVWVGVPNIPQFEAAVRQTLLSVQGVTEISSFTVITTANTGILNYVAVIKTIFGEGIING